MSRFRWCEQFIFLKGKPISFAGRPYLRAIYNTTARRIVLRCSRQVEKTTFLCNVVVHTAVTIPGVHIVVVFPRHEQAMVFAKSRLVPTITDSRVVRRALLGRRPKKPQLSHMRFSNRSEVYIRSAYLTADAVRGIDADYLLIDEYQDISSGSLPVMEEALSHSEHRRVLLTGTPKVISNHLEDAFNRSTANEWRVPCRCGELVFLDEQCMGLDRLICPACQSALAPSQGQWVPRNQDSAWGAGFTLNYLATPWLNYPELLERRDSYDLALFRNECLGLPTYLGDHMVSRAEVEQCCTERPMARSVDDLPRTLRGQLLAGVDWGGGATSRTVLVIGYIDDQDRFTAVFLERYPARDDPGEILNAIARRCTAFQVRLLAADGAGNGSVYNNLLLSALPQLEALYAMFYSVTDQQPVQHKGRLWNWTVGRTPSLGMVFSRIKKQRLRLPRLEDSSSFVDEIWCEMAEYDDRQRAIKYTHPETQPDDTLHALNYATILARRVLDMRLRYAE